MPRDSNDSSNPERERERERERGDDIDILESTAAHHRMVRAHGPGQHVQHLTVLRQQGRVGVFQNLHICHIYKNSYIKH